jgi:hypothetical protein
MSIVIGQNFFYQNLAKIQIRTRIRTILVTIGDRQGDPTTVKPLSRKYCHSLIYKGSMQVGESERLLILGQTKSDNINQIREH